MIIVNDSMIEFIEKPDQRHPYKNIFFNGVDTLIEVSIDTYTTDDKFTEDFEFFAKEYISATPRRLIPHRAKSDYINRKILLLIADKFPHLVL